MNATHRPRSLSGLAFLAILLLSTVSLQANPIPVGEGSFFQIGTFGGITIAILIEVLCVILLLRHRRTPRVFWLWLIALHLVSYPMFLGWLWLCLGQRPWLAVTTGEGLVVLIEGGAIYLLCRFAPSAKAALPSPSPGKALFVSLIGNIASMVAFPLIMLLNTWLMSYFRNSGIE